MNAERLHAVVLALDQEMNKSKIVGKMQDLVNALQNVINQPQGSNQDILAQNVKSVITALTNTAIDAFSPAYQQILYEMGGEDLFGSSLKLIIEEIFSRNQITPSIALGELQKIQHRLQAFKGALNQSAASFKVFGVDDEKLEPGDCEIGVLIPRAAVKNRLLEFAEEVKDLGFMLNTFSEVATGQKDDLEIRTISTSDFLVHLQASAPYAACVAVCIERVVALYKQLLEIRKLRQELKEQGVPDEGTTGIEDYAHKLMENGIEEITIDVINEYHKKDDKGRKHELTNAVRISLNKLANRIDKGFNLEVRVAAVPQQKDGEKADEALQKAVTTIQGATANMQFMKLEGKPILKLPEVTDKAKKKE